VAESKLAAEMSRHLRLVLALVGLLVVAACTPGPTPSPEPHRTLAWSALELPDGLNPSSLAVGGDALLVGGRSTTGGEHPGMVSVAADGTVTPLALRPTSPYAKVADLSSLATDGRTVYALGRAHGGAHSNFRWTTWQGSATGGLVEYPQSFYTFGGWEAGGLLDVVVTSDGPAIAGSWSSADGTGLDAAVWRLTGKVWKREASSGSPLANTPEVQVAPRSAAGHGSTMIISGSVITFPDGVQQSAAVWTRAGAKGSWQLVRLPEPGRTSEALSVACAEDCWVAGHADGQHALWRLPADGGATRESGLPAQPVDVDGPNPRTVVVQGRPGVLSSSGGKTTLLLQDDDGWTSTAGPDGIVQDATVLGDRLYAVIGAGAQTRLWVAPLRAS
jgi:hypothetical protein